MHIPLLGKVMRFCDLEPGAIDAIKGITRSVYVDRGSTPQEILDAVTLAQYVDDRSIVSAMPCGEGDQVEVVFFKVGGYCHNDDLANDYERRGLKPVDPYSLAVVNKTDRTLATKYPNGSIWKGADGEWCLIRFSPCGDVPNVTVRRADISAFEWAAGIRQ